MKIWILFCFSVSLHLTSKDYKLLNKVVYANAGSSVFFSLALRRCGPVFNPGIFTKYILVTGNRKKKSRVSM